MKYDYQQTIFIQATSHYYTYGKSGLTILQEIHILSISCKTQTFKNYL